MSTDGKSTILDGPYPDTKEQLGGYYVVNVKDMDAALELGGALPGGAPRDH